MFKFNKNGQYNYSFFSFEPHLLKSSRAATETKHINMDLLSI